MKNTTVRS